MFNQKSNGDARTLRVVRGVSLAHRRLNAYQRAVIAADILDGRVVYQPTEQELARSLKVSVPYIERARRLTPDQRRHLAISTMPAPMQQLKAAAKVSKTLAKLRMPQMWNGNGHANI
jgi:hypothetical protein